MAWDHAPRRRQHGRFRKTNPHVSSHSLRSAYNSSFDSEDEEVVVPSKLNGSSNMARDSDSLSSSRRHGSKNHSREAKDDYGLDELEAELESGLRQLREENIIARSRSLIDLNRSLDNAVDGVGADADHTPARKSTMSTNRSSTSRSSPFDPPERVSPFIRARHLLEAEKLKAVLDLERGEQDAYKYSHSHSHTEPRHDQSQTTASQRGVKLSERSHANDATGSKRGLRDVDQELYDHLIHDVASAHEIRDMLSDSRREVKALREELRGIRGTATGAPTPPNGGLEVRRSPYYPVKHAIHNARARGEFPETTRHSNGGDGGSSANEEEVSFGGDGSDGAEEEEEEWEQRIMRIVKTLSERNKMLEAEAMSLKSKTNQLGSSQRQTELLERTNSTLARLLESGVVPKQQAESELDEAHREIQTLRQSLRDARDVRKDVEAELEDKSNELEKLREERSRLVTTHNEERRKLRQEISELSLEKEIQVKRRTELEELLKSDRNAKQTAVEHERTRLNERIANLEQDLSRREDRETTAMHELNVMMYQMAQENSQLKELAEERMSDITELRERLSVAQEWRQDGQIKESEKNERELKALLQKAELRIRELEATKTSDGSDQELIDQMERTHKQELERKNLQLSKLEEENAKLDKELRDELNQKTSTTSKENRNFRSEINRLKETIAALESELQGEAEAKSRAEASAQAMKEKSEQTLRRAKEILQEAKEQKRQAESMKKRPPPTPVFTPTQSDAGDVSHLKPTSDMYSHVHELINKITQLKRQVELKDLELGKLRKGSNAPAELGRVKSFESHVSRLSDENCTLKQQNDEMKDALLRMAASQSSFSSLKTDGKKPKGAEGDEDYEPPHSPTSGKARQVIEKGLEERKALAKEVTRLKLAVDDREQELEDLRQELAHVKATRNNGAASPETHRRLQERIDELLERNHELESENHELKRAKAQLERELVRAKETASGRVNADVAVSAQKILDLQSQIHDLKDVNLRLASGDATGQQKQIVEQQCQERRELAQKVQNLTRQLEAASGTRSTL